MSEVPSPFMMPSIGIGNFTLVFALFALSVVIILILLLWMMFHKRN